MRLRELTQAIDDYADEAFAAGVAYELGKINRAIHAAAAKADELGNEATGKGDSDFAARLYRVANQIRALAGTPGDGLSCPVCGDVPHCIDDPGGGDHA